MSWIFDKFPGLSPYMFWLKLVGILIIILALMAMGAYGMHIYDDRGYQTERADREAANAAALAKEINRRQEAEKKHDDDQARITDVNNQLRRMRNQFHLCTSSGNQNGAARILSSRVDEGFAKLQDRAAELFQRCDQLNIDAIRANGGS